MGIKGLREFVKTHSPKAIKKKNIKQYKGKWIAVDSSLLIYQYVIAIRNTGQDLENDKGEMTSHIHAIIQRLLTYLEKDLKPIFVFDGEPPKLKKDHTLKTRKSVRQKAKEKMDTETDEKEKIKYFKRTTVIKDKHMKEVQEILRVLGVPVVVAPEEADSQCARLVKDRLAYAVSSDDTDILTFGAKRLIRGFSAKGQVEELSLDEILKGMDITMNQFIEICILLGSDYTCTLKGVGKKRIMNLIKEHGSIDKYFKANPEKKCKAFKYKETKVYFKNPQVLHLKRKDVKYTEPDFEKFRSLLKDKYNFHPGKIQGTIIKLKDYLQN